MALPRMEDVAVAPLTVGRPEPPEMVAAAEAGGFRRLGISLWAPDEGLGGCCTDAGLLRRTVRALAHSGAEVTDVSVVVLTSRLDLGDVRRMLEVACGLGAGRVGVMNREPDAGRAAALLAAVGDLAGDLGMLVGLEFMPYSATPDLEAAAGLVRAVANPRVGVVLDLLHLFRSGGGPKDVSQNAVPLVLVQLCDAVGTRSASFGLRQEALADRRYPGEGDLPVRDVLSAVSSGVPMTLEAPVAQHAGLTPAERARRAGSALRAFVAAHIQAENGHWLP